MSPVILLPAAQRGLDALQGNIYQRIVKALHALADNPRPHGVKKLKGRREYWRIRVGDYRIIYAIQEERLLVCIARLGHRRDVYD